MLPHRLVAWSWLPPSSPIRSAHPTSAPSSSSVLSTDGSAPSSLTIPFFTVGGFAECGWYRRALCIAEDFLSSNATDAATHTGGALPLSSSPSSPPAAALPPVRIEALTLPRQTFRHYLLHLMESEQVDLKDHFSCPVILEGSCTLTAQLEEDSGEREALQQRDISSASSISSSSSVSSVSSVSCVCRADRLVGGYSEWERLLRERYGFVSNKCGRGTQGEAGKC